MKRFLVIAAIFLALPAAAAARPPVDGSPTGYRGWGSLESQLRVDRLAETIAVSSRTLREAPSARRASSRMGHNSASIPIGGQSCNWYGAYNVCWLGGRWYDEFWWMDMYSVSSAYGIGFTTCYTGNRGFGPTYCYAGLPG